MLLKINGVVRLVKDPEQRFTQEGKSIVTFSGVSSEKYGDKENACFIDFTVFGGLGEKVVMPYLKKGAKVSVSGKLNQDTWEKDGQKRSKHAVIIHDIELLGEKSQSTQQTQSYSAPQPQNYSQPAPSQQATIPSVDVETENIPF